MAVQFQEAEYSLPVTTKLTTNTGSTIVYHFLCTKLSWTFVEANNRLISFLLIVLVFCWQTMLLSCRWGTSSSPSATASRTLRGTCDHSQGCQRSL